jgi:hypothetical protein
MNAIGEINQWCQKNQKELPTYDFEGFGTVWTCTFSASWFQIKLTSEEYTSKKAAKERVAQMAWSMINKKEKTNIDLDSRTVVLIDGDQRVDCWRWFASKDVKWENNLEIIVFVGPSSYVEECHKIQVEKSKTTSKDSADALILITLGKILSRRNVPKILVVSADHILVQAAMDTDGVDYVSNLKELKKYFR